MWIDPLSKRLFKGAGLITAQQGRGPIVLMYHSVQGDEGKDSSVWSVNAKSFSNQMGFLKKEGWQTFLFRDLLNAENLPPKSVVITFDDGFADNYENGFKVLKNLSMCATWFIASGCIGKKSAWHDPDGPPKSMLSERQIYEMAEAGMEIGAHSRTHVSLPTLDSKKLEDEVMGSKEDLTSLLGQPVLSFAYPFGHYDERSLDAVRRAGYLVACTTETGWFGGEKNLLKVRRIPVFPYDTLGRFARKFAFADPAVGWSVTGRYLAQQLKVKLRSKNVLKGDRP